MLQHHFTGVRTVSPTAGLDRVFRAKFGQYNTFKPHSSPRLLFFKVLMLLVLILFFFVVARILCMFFVLGPCSVVWFLMSFLV